MFQQKGKREKNYEQKKESVQQKKWDRRGRKDHVKHRRSVMTKNEKKKKAWSSKSEKRKKRTDFGGIFGCTRRTRVIQQAAFGGCLSCEPDRRIGVVVPLVLVGWTDGVLRCVFAAFQKLRRGTGGGCKMQRRRRRVHKEAHAVEIKFKAIRKERNPVIGEG